MPKVMLHTGTGVFEVLAKVCHNPLEAVKQFVENAADAIEQSKTGEGQIAIELQYEPVVNGHTERRLKGIAVRDNGVGMTPEKMKQVLERIGDSEKIHLALRGEQGIGILAFALLADELHLASSASEGMPSNCLVLKRSWLKKGGAEIIEGCRAHLHHDRGTVAYLGGILPEIASQLSGERIKSFLGRQFAADLKGSVYSMSLSDAHHQEQIHPQRFRGVRVISTSLSLGRSGTAVVELYVLPWEAGDAAIGLYGRGGTRICSLTDLEDFKVLPWQDGRLEGYIRCDRLKRTADKTALVQDETYNVFVSRLRQLEPQVMELVMKVSAQAQEQRFNIVLNRAGRVIDRFLRYRDRGLLTDMNMVPFSGMNRGHIFIRQAEGRLGEGESGTTTVKTARPVLHTPTRAPHIMLYSPPEAKSTYRSWYDPKQGIICINREHTEFLLSQRDERRCIRYLFSIWAKESLLQEYGDEAERIADEMVGVLAEAEPLLW